MPFNFSLSTGLSRLGGGVFLAELPETHVPTQLRHSDDKTHVVYFKPSYLIPSHRTIHWHLLEPHTLPFGLIPRGYHSNAPPIPGLSLSKPNHILTVSMVKPLCLSSLHMVCKLLHELPTHPHPISPCSCSQTHWCQTG